MAQVENNPNVTPRVYFDAALHPHRSLSATGFYVVMGLATFFGIAIGVGFTLVGAWPVLGFCGVEILLLLLAFRINYRNGLISEHLLLSDDGLRVRRLSARGKITRQWLFEPGWLRVSIGRGRRNVGVLTLASYGKSLVIGDFLSPDERLELADALRGAIETYQQPPGVSA
ncbi:MAG: DUF2244 domain-containing protein [Alphaproteobacteria bacterium]|nr:DUF2244 domain-containing protein [Alphaproteobacteria bacterium]